jgi:hypothetical protein
MSKFSEYMESKSATKGGVIGGLLGALLSTKSYSATDNSLKKAGKTGLFAALGYLIGEFLEKLFTRKTGRNSF